MDEFLRIAERDAVYIAARAQVQRNEERDARRAAVALADDKSDGDDVVGSGGENGTMPAEKADGKPKGKPRKRLSNKQPVQARDSDLIALGLAPGAFVDDGERLASNNTQEGLNQ